MRRPVYRAAAVEHLAGNDGGGGGSTSIVPVVGRAFTRANDRDAQPTGGITSGFAAGLPYVGLVGRPGSRGDGIPLPVVMGPARRSDYWNDPSGAQCQFSDNGSGAGPRRPRIRSPTATVPT